MFDSAESAEYKEVLHQVEDNHVGGLIIVTDRGPLGLERSQVYPTAVITNELQRRAKVPLIVGADFEAGTGMRIDEGTSFPSAMAIAATGDPKLAYEAGKYTALEARAAGVQWIFAPDADVNNNPDNPIINIRSFGEDPASVAAYVTEFVRGVQDNGALATAKHFPGHGNVGVDSHISPAGRSRRRARIWKKPNWFLSAPPSRLAWARSCRDISPCRLSKRIRGSGHAFTKYSDRPAA